MSEIYELKKNSLIKSDDIITESGTNPYLCFQCNKCTAGCPVAYEMDLTPAQIIQAVRLDRHDLAFSSKTIWLCASCETCSTRCPQGVDIAAVMDACRIYSRKKKMKSAVPTIPSFFESALNNIRIFGRLYELGLIVTLKLKTKELTKDMDLGQKMFFKGKLKIIPDIPKTAKEVRKILNKIYDIEKDSR